MQNELRSRLQVHFRTGKSGLVLHQGIELLTKSCIAATLGDPSCCCPVMLLPSHAAVHCKHVHVSAPGISPA
jgi:hypothetical protein